MQKGLLLLLRIRSETNAILHVNDTAFHFFFFKELDLWLFGMMRIASPPSPQMLWDADNTPPCRGQVSFIL